MIKRKLAGVYGPNLKCTKPADCLTDRSANQNPPYTRIVDSRPASNQPKSPKNFSALPLLCQKKKTNRFESIHVSLS